VPPSARRHPIVFLLTSFDVGGTERQMVELIHRLDRSQFDVHVACFHRRGALEGRARDGATSLETFPIRGFYRPSSVAQWLAFARWCRRIGARIVHTCEFYANVFGLPAAAFAGIDVRIGNRRELITPDKSRAQLACQRLAYSAAHVVVANSSAAAAQLRREGVPAHKIRTIPNGIDLEAFAHTRERRPLRRIVMVANLRVEKGHDTLITAAPAIIERHPDVEFWIVGDGPLRRGLEQDVADRGLGSRFVFHGQRHDVPALLAESDLFVLPSRTEAAPNSVLEAMAAGLPCVATRVGGIPEFVDDGVTGRLIDPDQPHVLASVLLDLIEHPDVAADLGRAARQHVERRFSFDRMVTGFEALYHTELDKRSARREPSRELVASPEQRRRASPEPRRRACPEQRRRASPEPRRRAS
jgi:glycosyltransferase involved in cell wall biosynthesis